MSHATPVEIHDHVYDFRRSAHVQGCLECLRSAETLESERQALRAALADEAAEAPPQFMAALAARARGRRRRSSAPALPWVGLAAAAALLAGLAWLLFQDRNDSLSAAARRQADPLDRLIGELKSASGPRREMAGFALRAFGEAATDKLKAAGIDPATLLSGRDAGVEDPEVAGKLKSTRVTIDLQNSSLAATVNFLQDVTGIRMSIDPKSIPRADEDQMSIKVQDIVADGALKLMLVPRGYSFALRGREVVIYRGEPPAWIPPARAPVRLGTAPGDLRRVVRALESDSVEDREAAAATLRQLGFAAEPALWDALDSTASEVRSRATDLLRRLYTPAEAAPRGSDSLRRALSQTAVSVDIENATLAEGLKLIADAVGVTLLVDPRLPPSNKPVTFKVQAVPADRTLRLLLDPFRLQTVPAGDWALITDRDPIVRTGSRGPIWLPPGDARSLEELVAGLASADPQRRRKAEDSVPGAVGKTGPAVYHVLLQAAAVLDAQTALRCRAAARAAALKSGHWLYDEPSGAELQRWTASQKRLFEKKVDLDLDGETLEKALERLGVAATFKASPAGRLSGALRGMNQLDFLKVATRLNGLDFTIGGDTVIVDVPPGK